MIRQKILSYSAVIIVLLLAACEQVQAPTVTPLPSATLTFSPSATPLPTQTATLSPSPTPLTEVRSLRQVTSLPDQLSKVYTFIDAKIRAPDDGSVWVITRQAVARWNERSWDFVYPLEEDMLADVDRGGRLWVVHQDAEEIAAWQNGQWTTYGAESGWMNAHITTPWQVSTTEDGTVWLPTGEDIRHFDSKRWTVHTLRQMGFPSLPESDEWIVHRVAMLEGGEQVWIGECYEAGPGPVGGSGVRWFTKQTWHGAQTPVGSECVSIIHADPAGNVWIGVRDAIWRYEPFHRTWTVFPVPDTRDQEQYNFTYPLDLVVDESGDAWVYLQYCGGASCDTGHSKLYHIHGEEWSQVFDMQEYPTLLRQLALDGDGQAWLFWDGTAYRLLGDKITPAAELAAIGVTVSPDGQIWILTSHENDGALWVLEP